jgi:hypothetical protein
MTSRLGFWSAIAVLAMVIIAAVLLVMMWRLGRRQRAGRRLLPDVTGTATIEFALVLPMLLTLSMILAQTSMLMGGNLIVHYAAFAAARSAIVQIPYAYPGYPANTYTSAPGTPKREAIFRTAVFALAPVGGKGGGGGLGTINSGAYTDALTQFYGGMGMAPPPWISALAGDRVAYAAANTEIALLKADNTGDPALATEITNGTVDARDPLMVRVQHKLNLGVPYANRIFADGATDNGRYTNIAAVVPLTNEGILDTMPPETPILRTPNTP